MGCPCCDIVILDDNGKDINAVPDCEICGFEANLPEQRIDLFGHTYHVDCLKRLLNGRKVPRFDPAIFR